MANLPLAFAEILIGGIVATAGITGDSFGNIIKGEITRKPLDGASSSGSSGGSASSHASGGGSGATAGSSKTVVGSVTTAELRQVAAGFGWDGAQISDWMQVISKESGGNPNATNSSSTAAYGIGQFFAGNQNRLPQAQQLALNKQKYYSYGGDPNTVIGQLLGMANYIKDRYGDPAGALQHEANYGNY